MINKKYLRFLYTATLAFSVLTGPFAPALYAQTAPAAAQTAPAAAPDLKTGLQAIEERVEKRRQELGIPGLSLVIVKDGAVVFAKGFGYKDFEGKVPVTPDTQFGIGSATKAFTALSVLMAADEGRLALDESPKKYLSYFKMYDPETDRNITVRDLMTHGSGLNRTDLAMITGRLGREELIRVAGEAKPMAKLREKFFYQNIMYAAAGEIAAQVEKTSYEKLIPERIFKPLGMTNSNMTIPELERAKDRSFGYEYNFDTKETRRLPYRSIADTAPAGSINSSANDMAKWIAFVMNGGVAPDGRRLVSEKNFAEWTAPQMKITPDGRVSYGLGWFLRQWNGLKVVEHGGNIDGFNSLVAMIPEKKLGFVMLTNVTASPLGSELMPVVWANVLGDPNKAQAVPADAMAKEVGKYSFAQAGFDIEVKLQDGKLAAFVPNQPTYVLENVGGRRYKMAGAPDGFFITFKDDSLYLEQPQGNYTLPKKSAEQKTAAAAGEAARELVGKYAPANGAGEVEIKLESDGRVTVNVPGQPAFALAEKSKDAFTLAPLPDTYLLKVRRDAENKVAAVVFVQPEGEFELKRVGGAAETKPAVTADELMAKAIEAAGGEANWRKLTTRVAVVEMDFVNQGVKAVATSYGKAPNRTATETTMTALGKTIARGWEFFDGARGEEIYSFAPVEKYAGKKLEDVRLNSDFYSVLNWKTNYKTVAVKGVEKVGDEECYVVELVPEKGTKVTQLYSTKTYLLMKQRGVSVSSTSENSLPYTLTFSDYRDVDGVKVPFRTVNESPSMGEIVTVVKSIRHNVPVDDKTFAPRSVELK